MNDSAPFLCFRCHAPVEQQSGLCPLCGDDLSDARENPTAQIGRVIAQKYTLESLLGVGGMGMVFRARRHLIEDEVALKLLYSAFLKSPLQRNLFRNEALASARLSHPNIVTLYDWDLSDETRTAYLAMELLNGRPLKELLREKAPLPLKEALPILIDVSAALAAAHRSHVIHRDLKPDNIFLQDQPGKDRPQIKLVDFGIAAMLDAQPPENEENALLGTLRYMSPEQCMGEPCDARSDLYALGVVAYEMLTKHRVTGRSIADIVYARVEPPNHLLPPERALPEAMEALLMSMLAKKPEGRPASAVELHERLQAIARSLEESPETAIAPGAASATTHPLTDPQAPATTGALSKTALTLVLVAVALVAALLMFFVFK